MHTLCLYSLSLSIMLSLVTSFLLVSTSTLVTAAPQAQPIMCRMRPSAAYFSTFSQLQPQSNPTPTPVAPVLPTPVSLTARTSVQLAVSRSSQAAVYYPTATKTYQSYQPIARPTSSANFVTVLTIQQGYTRSSSSIASPRPIQTPATTVQIVNQIVSTPSSSPSIPSSSDQQQCLDLHNQARGQVGVPLVSWSNELAAAASSYARQLYTSSPSSGSLVHSQQKSQGENLYWASGQGASMSRGTQSWIAEKSAYYPGSAIGSGNFGTYGHYSQLIYRQVTQIGCGSAGGYVVCRYDKMQQSGTNAY